MSGGNKRGSRLLAPGLTWRFVGARASQSAEHGEKKLNHNNNNNVKKKKTARRQPEDLPPARRNETLIPTRKLLWQSEHFLFLQSGGA